MIKDKNLTKLGKICLSLKIIRVKKSKYLGQADKIKLNKWNPLAWLFFIYILVTDSLKEAKKSFQ